MDPLEDVLALLDTRSHLSSSLRDVVSNPSSTAAIAARGRERVLRDLSWDVAAAMVRERLVELASIVPVRFQNELALSQR